MKRAVVVAVMVAGLSLAHPAAASAEMDAGKAFWKLSRGAINLVTGWVEIPKRIHETSQTSGTFAGFTWGLLRGIGHGFVRTVAGGYELITFPVPGTTQYGPVIQPEYVFTDTTTPAGTYEAADPASPTHSTYSK